MQLSSKPKSWFNREIFGFGLVSLFSDLSHEVSTAVLPLFLNFLGAPPQAVGLIEGISDGLASFGKYIGGWVSDHVKNRKYLAVLGYMVVALSQGLFGFCPDWRWVFAVRAAGWFGRGWRSPIHDALFHDTVTPETSGRAFGFERTMDTIGALIAPVAAFFLLPKIGFSHLFFLTWIPGFLTVLCFMVFVREHRQVRHDYQFSFRSGFKEMPADFKYFLTAVTLFGLSDFSSSLIIFWAGVLLKPVYGVYKASGLAILMYGFHNLMYAVSAFPAGWLADRIGKFKVLSFGYGLACVFYLGFMFAGNRVGWFFLLFGLRGVFLAIEHTLEKAIAGDLLRPEIKGTGYGILASLNGIGDLVSSILVGFLFATNSVFLSFGYCLLMAGAGTFLLLRISRNTPV